MKVASLVATALLVGSSTAAMEQVIEVTSRPGGDTVTWAQINVPPSTVFPTPLRFASYGGIKGIATVEQGGNARIERQAGCNNGIFDGNFAPSDFLLLPDHAPAGASLTLSFRTPLILAASARRSARSLTVPSPPRSRPFMETSFWGRLVKTEP